MKHKGLTSAQATENREKYGSNELTQLPKESLMKKLLKGFTDPMIIILLAALVIQVVLFICGQAEWYEPAGILIAILIANGVSAVSEYKQENKAKTLKEQEEAKETANVMRDGRLVQIHVSEVVVGDIVYLQSGDKISADGEVIDGEITVDQAVLNGETEEALKTPDTDSSGYDIKDLLNRHYIYRGTVVCSGEAYMEVKVVGDRTLFGELALEVQEDTRKTPLQIKLGKLAKQISVFGYIGAAAIITCMILRSIVTGQIPSDFAGWVRLLVNAVTVAVTIIVCAVPEGLPMLTSILLSYQSLRMAKDNVLVRKINGLETAGSLSILFSDKTGTITEGKLSVSELATGDLHTFSGLDNASPLLVSEIVNAIGVNNGAVANGSTVLCGNSTDRALMQFLVSEKLAGSVNKDGLISFEAFDSNKKTSSAAVNTEGRTVTYIKGAPERITGLCSWCLDENGIKKPFTDKDGLNEYIDRQAGRSMRLLAAAKEEDGEYTLICIISIRDNVRAEAALAIKEVQQAGIQVVMVTGDRKETAVAIARDAGLLSDPDDVALTSSELAQKSDEELKELMPHLRVIARALPTDKSRLVRAAQELDHVVGMTGDGVNDSPALKKADVGFAMGSGTEVAKEAGDITILDDNFSSIGKAILYGRTMFKSIRKFLIFQLTVNVAAVLICFIGPMMGVNVVLTVIQLLLINLAMDTLAAIAFGSEPAIKEYMKEKPVPRKAGIISGNMLIEVLISAFYIAFVCLSILFHPFIRDLFGSVDETYLRSALFAVFMMAITFNGFNARTEHINIFKGLHKNKSFIAVMTGLLIIQFLFVTFGGEFLSVESLSPQSWLICLLLAFMVIPIDIIRKIIMKK